MKFISFALAISLSFNLNAKSFKGTADCEKEKLAEFYSITIDKVQTREGIKTKETKLSLEDHYYPQMSRPSYILIDSKKKIESASLIHSNRKIDKLVLKKVVEGTTKINLPELKKFSGKIQLVFKGDSRCERSLIYEELSP